MKVWGLTLVVTSLLACAAQAAPSASAEEGPAARLRKDLLKEIGQSRLRNHDLGLIVVQDEGENEQIVLDVNASKRMIPASLTKIVTAGAALEKLPVNFQFKTQLVASDTVTDGVLGGSLYLKGGGDPAFVSESMWVLVNDFARTGIRTISGDIIVDDSRFDSETFGDSRESRRVDRAYDAPIGAMSFNWNSVNVYIRPGKTVGAAAEVFLDPVNSYAKLENKARTGKPGSARTLAVSRTSLKNGDQIMVTGQIAVDAEEAVFYKSITYPALWSGAHLIEFLRQRGIEVKGQVKRGTAPTTARVLASTSSRPLPQLVADMAKFSNNFVAEMLTKNLAVENGSNPGTMNQGLEVIRSFLDDVGLKRTQYALNNPSGFTRANEFAPADLQRVLTHLRKQFTIFPEFLSALPIAGVDGTLKSRIKGNGAKWVRAKTGLLDGVVGLAGFAARPAGSQFSFVFIYNGGASAVDVRALFDRLADRLTR